MNLIGFLYPVLWTRLNSLSGIFLSVCLGVLVPLDSTHALLSQVDLETSKTGLAGASSTAVSPDGQHVYVASAFPDQAVAVLRRDPATGQLSLVQALFDGVGGVDGLSGATSVTISPDGQHVYVAARGDNAVAVFRRDPMTGQLSFVQALFDGVGGVDGLGEAASITVSPDGQHVYVAAQGDNAVAVFRRDPATGQLSVVQALFDDAGGVDGLGGASSVTISPDGQQVYVAAHFDAAVAMFRRDPATGQLSLVQALFDGVGGVDGLDTATSVTVSPDGQHVYVAAYFDAAVAVFRRDPMTGQLSFVQALFDGVDGVDGLLGASSVTISPEGQHVYVAGNSDQAVAVFTRDPATGQLSFVQVLSDGVGGVDGLNEVESITVSPEGQHVYVASAFPDQAVTVFRRDPATGQLSVVQALFDDTGGMDGLDGASSVTISPDGQHVYVAASRDAAVAVFRRDPATGQLSFVQALFDGVDGVDGLLGASSVTISPDGQYVYVTAPSEDALAVFRRDPATGQLSVVQVLSAGAGGVSSVRGAQSVTVSPDGQEVYVVASGFFTFGRELVAVFRRDPATGQLSVVQVLSPDSGNPIKGSSGMLSVAVSPDEQHMYVATVAGNTIEVFRRDPATGRWSFEEVQVLRDGEGGVDGLDDPVSITVSPDGQHVYVAALGDHAVAVFRRDPATGQLSLVQVLFDDTDGVDGLNVPVFVTVSSDGQHVYVAAPGDDALTVFRRDPATGQLSLVQVLFHDPGRIDGLAGASAVIVSPDRQHVYVTSPSEDAVAAFAVQAIVSPTTTTLTSTAPDLSTVGQAVTVTYTVTAAAGTPSGRVTVRAGSDSCTGTVASGSCQITFTSPGTKLLVASYAGDANFVASVSAGAAHTVTTGPVTPAATLITITSAAPDPSTVGQAVTVTYTVTAAVGTPSGTVTVSAGADSCTGTVASGSCQITFTSPGSKLLVARYAGEGDFAASVSAGEPHTVNAAPITPAATLTTITSATPDPSTVSQAVTVTYTVTSLAGTPSGTVTVSAGTDSCTGTVAEGTCQLIFTSAGDKTLVASYAGGGDFAPSVSAGEAHTVVEGVPIPTLDWWALLLLALLLMGAAAGLQRPGRYTRLER